MTSHLSSSDETGEATLDDFLGGRVRAWQPCDGPRSGIDAVILAAAIPVREGKRETVLEAGASTGVVSLAVAERAGDAEVTAVEIQPDLAALARRNADLNGMADRLRVVEVDITGPWKTFDEAGLRQASFRHVAANPPFYDPARSRKPGTPSKTRAHQAAPAELDRWLRFCAGMAMPGATLTLIHRPEMLPELLAAIGRRFGGLIVFPLFPSAGKPATRMLVQGMKGSRAPLQLMRGLVLHGDDGGFTPEAEAILRNGRVLDLNG
ncbi:MAG: methyltransferase [Pseudomonadota bacterium]|nr:methyltransferase [Pseudomonadota bacterium]